MDKQNLKKILKKNAVYKNKHVFGVCGYARSGKNTFCDIIEKIGTFHKLKVKTFSFAFSLKKDLDSFCNQSFGFSSFTEGENKALIRPSLIAYGESKRKSSDGSFWWLKLMGEINSFFDDGGDVAIISDLRFKEYPIDEVDFVKSYPSSTIVAVERLMEDGNLSEPAHQSETKNFPRLYKASNLKIRWKSVGKDLFLLLPQIPEAIIYMNNIFKKLEIKKTHE